MPNFSKQLTKLILPVSLALLPAALSAAPKSTGDITASQSQTEAARSISDSSTWDAPERTPTLEELRDFRVIRGPSSSDQKADRIDGKAVRRCPKGQLVMKIRFDDDGHPIPSTMMGNCVSAGTN